MAAATEVFADYHARVVHANALGLLALDNHAGAFLVAAGCWPRELAGRENGGMVHLGVFQVLLEQLTVSSCAHDRRGIFLPTGNSGLRASSDRGVCTLVTGVLRTDLAPESLLGTLTAMNSASGAVNLLVLLLVCN